MSALRALGAALALAATLAGCGGGPGAGDAGPRVIAVAVTENGFQPAQIEVARGERVELAFKRTTDATCATGAVFENGEKYDLPLGQEVRVTVPTDSVGTIAWACPMGMYRSTVTVK